MSAPPLRVVVIGLSLSSSWGNGHATTFRALLADRIAGMPPPAHYADLDF